LEDAGLPLDTEISLIILRRSRRGHAIVLFICS